MIEIEYRFTKDFTAESLESLFLSVGWSSGHYPQKLVLAMRNSATVISAWSDGHLVGLINAMDDGVMTAYIHFLLIKPDFQDKGIGHELVKRMTEHYSEFLRLVLIAYEKELGFYERQGFRVGEDKVPMFITSLWT
jgi:ribosomal protein S18 acetylase RimI-like enzyme